MITSKNTRPNRSLFLLACCILVSSISFSQKDATGTENANKYRLDLPPEWQKPKLISAITEIISKTFEELRGKDYCTDGKTRYIVQPVIESIQVGKPLNSTGIVGNSYITTYPISFFAGLRLYDSSGKAVTQLVLVRPTEIFDYRKNDISNTQNGMMEDRTVYDSSGKMAVATIRTRVPDPVMKDFQQENLAANPPLDFLMGICEQKIYETKKMLKKLADKN